MQVVLDHPYLAGVQEDLDRLRQAWMDDYEEYDKRDRTELKLV